MAATKCPKSVPTSCSTTPTPHLPAALARPLLCQQFVEPPHLPTRWKRTGRRGVTTRATFHGRPWNLPVLPDSDKLSEYGSPPHRPKAHQGDEPATTRTRYPDPALHQSAVAYGFGGQVWPELARPDQLGRSTACRCRDRMSRRLPAHAASGWLEVDFRFSPSPCRGQYPPSRWQLSCRGGLADRAWHLGFSSLGPGPHVGRKVLHHGQPGGVSR